MLVFLILLFVTLSHTQEIEVTRETSVFISPIEISTNITLNTNTQTISLEISPTNISTNATQALILSFEHKFSTRRIIEALAQAYPDIVQNIPQEENKYFPLPAFKIKNTIFYERNGRFLPESALNDWENFNKNSFYDYSVEIPDPEKRTKEEIDDIRRRASQSYRRNRSPEHPMYKAVLYGMEKQSDTNSHIVTSQFLGKQVRINKLILSPLKAVEKELYDSSNNNNLIRDFLREVDTVYSFYWRNIAGTQAKSMHAYGMAIDLLNSRSKKSAYWLWRQSQKIDWVREPISVRWNPPKDVIDIFEKHGFIWGGKWNFYDTMHFEYRPELLLLNDFDVHFQH